MLSRSPLSMVLAQIRFPMELPCLGPSNYGALDVAMAEAGFPMTSSDQDSILDINRDGSIKAVRQAERRGYASGDLSLSATIGASYISLFCVNRGDGIKYVGHEAFIEKLGEISRLLEPTIGQIAIARMGYRYVDSIPLNLASKVLSGAFLGAYALALDGGLGFSVSLPGVEGYFSEGDGSEQLGSGVPNEAVRLMSRVIEPRTIIDQAIPLSDEPLWVVDMDSYSLSTEGLAYSRDAIEGKMTELAQRARALFYGHVIVREEFEQQFG